MNVLPHIYLQWNQSIENPLLWLRYHVYRRVVGTNDWLRVGVITAYDRAYYQDYRAQSGVTYEYAVTQVVSVDTGEELESTFPNSVIAASLTIRNVFIHDVMNPLAYVELPVQATSVQVNNSIRFVQVWSRLQPTAHANARQYQTYQMSLRNDWPTIHPLWDAIGTLISRQYDNGAIMCIRGYRDVKAFGQLLAPNRSDDPATSAIKLSFQQTYFNEEVQI